MGGVPISALALFPGMRWSVAESRGGATAGWIASYLSGAHARRGLVLTVRVRHGVYKNTYSHMTVLA